MKPTFQFRVPANLFAAVCVARDTTRAPRYWLEGVKFEMNAFGNILMIATDGKIMTVAGTKYQETDTLYLAGDYTNPLEISKPLEANAKKAKAETVCLKDDGIVRVLDKLDVPIYMENAGQIDGTFPDWRRIIPGHLGGKLRGVGFSSAPMRRILETGKIATGNNNATYSVSFNEDDTSPVLVQFDGEPGLFSIIMPSRSKTSYGDYPFDISLKEPKAIAAE